jgi:lactate dehydrogenase-like 2-hydroxyacid dehydrogenase
MPRALVTPTILRNVPGDYSEILLQGGFEVIYPPDGYDTFNRESLLKLLEGIDAMLASTEPLTRDVLGRTKLRAIARMGVGYDSIDVPAATELGIAVTITPGTLEESVAEHTVALMLGVTRAIVPGTVKCGRACGLAGRCRECPARRLASSAWGGLAGRSFRACKGWE